MKKILLLLSLVFLFSCSDSNGSSTYTPEGIERNSVLFNEIYITRVVSNFIVQALQNKDITVYGDGSQTRSFCFASDLVEAILLTMEQTQSVGPINIGNPGEFTILELAEKVIKLTGSKSKIIKEPLPSDDPKHRQPDISKAKKILNWEPKINLEEGLALTIEYFRRGL